MKEIKTEMTITAPKGMQIDQEAFKKGKIEFTPIKKQLPQSWEELEAFTGYFIGAGSTIEKCILNLDRTLNNRNVFPTKELAEAALALAQLLQLRDYYNDGWKADWRSGDEKHCIEIYSNDWSLSCWQRVNAVLHFKTEELRDTFFNAPEIKELLEIAKPLL